MKILLSVIGVFFAFSSLVEAQEQGRYVRKKMQPEFFMPQGAMGRPEKLPTPRYYEGQDDTVHNAKPNEDMGRSPDLEEEPLIINTLQNIDAQPAYKLKYQDYTKDLEQIDATGKMPENVNLEKDLQKMNSNERVLIESIVQ